MISRNANRLLKISSNVVKPRFYHENVIEHFENPKNVGTFDKNDPNVGTAVVGAPACGDVMKLQIKVNPETMVIEDSCFKTFGCGSAISSSSYGTEYIKGKSLEEAGDITNREIFEHLNLPPVKFHCASLLEDAVKGAVSDFKNKKILD
jgi:Fe-S cluster assembly scaffold IscU